MESAWWGTRQLPGSDRNRFFPSSFSPSLAAATSSLVTLVSPVHPSHRDISSANISLWLGLAHCRHSLSLSRAYSPLNRIEQDVLLPTTAGGVQQALSCTLDGVLPATGAQCLGQEYAISLSRSLSLIDRLMILMCDDDDVVGSFAPSLGARLHWYGRTRYHSVFAAKFTRLIE